MSTNTQETYEATEVERRQLDYLIRHGKILLDDEPLETREDRDRLADILQGAEIRTDHPEWFRGQLLRAVAETELTAQEFAEELADEVGLPATYRELEEAAEEAVEAGRVSREVAEEALEIIAGAIEDEPEGRPDHGEMYPGGDEPDDVEHRGATLYGSLGISDLVARQLDREQRMRKDMAPRGRREPSAENKLHWIHRNRDDDPPEDELEAVEQRAGDDDSGPTVRESLDLEQRASGASTPVPTTGETDDSGRTVRESLGLTGDE